MTRSNNGQIAKLALGTVQFGLQYGIANQQGQISVEEGKAMLQLALRDGIDTLDTAIAYGDSESRLGEIGISQFRVVTKLPPLPDDIDDAARWVKDQFSGSQRRLGVDPVYGLLLHRPGQLMGVHGAAIYRALEELRADGMVQKFGVSIYSPAELDILMPKFRFQLIQAPFNLLDRRLHSSGWLKKLKQEKVEIHTRSAFLQGLLLMPKDQIPAKFSKWQPLWDEWHDWLTCHSMTAIEAALAYPLTIPEIDRVVIGADNSQQLAQIVAAATRVCGDFPALYCEDEQLINPGNWNQL